MLRLLVEMLLVAAGVLLALAVDEWNSPAAEQESPPASHFRCTLVLLDNAGAGCPLLPLPAVAGSMESTAPGTGPTMAPCTGYPLPPMPMQGGPVGSSSRCSLWPRAEKEGGLSPFPAQNLTDLSSTGEGACPSPPRHGALAIGCSISYY